MKYVFRLCPITRIATLSLILGAPCAVRAQPPDPVDRTLAAEDASRALRLKARALTREVSALRKREPKRALALLDAFFNKKPPLIGELASLVRLRADIQLENLKDAQGALETYDYAREWNVAADPKLPAWAEVELLAGEAKTRLASKDAVGAVETLQAGWPVIVASNQNQPPHLWRRTKEAAQLYFKALDQSGRKDQAPDLLARHLLQSPVLLGFSQQEGDLGTLLLQEICARLNAANRPDEAMAWSRLGYATCDYSAPALESATAQLALTWGDLGQTRAFGIAQTDAGAPNPLDAIALPALSEATRAALEASARELEAAPAQMPADESRESQLIGLYLASGRNKDAMELAWQMAQAEPDSPQGASQVCRVFKAADLDLVRAQAFLVWKRGQGENPVTAFLGGNAD